ncbi:MAG: sulfur transferase domain-containing protein [Hyphomicrobium sp.]|jgi:protein tyrosine/serine phosphatase
MARLTKNAKRVLRRAISAGGRAVLGVTPGFVRRWAAPYAPYADMLFGDHLVIRVAFPNRHRLSAEAWRAAQPLPHQIMDLARRGIRTVINLRGVSASSTYLLEKQACEKAGLTMLDFRVRSRGVPTRSEVLEARALFDRVEYPILMHCKSGSDRAGLMSALYLHVRCGVPIAIAKKQLALRYGHIRQADTGVLDAFFERYLEDSERQPMPFFEWVETVYDPDELKQTFHASGWANRIVNGLLKRE